ncbi:hypothetical protein HY311_00385 [Candidatus Nomurabacteria bacterium]|nr:hypothetical protein [Candidatus Nomurabacteria bacterium]
MKTLALLGVIIFAPAALVTIFVIEVVVFSAVAFGDFFLVHPHKVDWEKVGGCYAEEGQRK